MRPAPFACVVVLFFSSVALAQSNPVPLINNPLVPANAAPGGTDFTLTVNGTGFVQSSVVNWNKSPLATTYVSSSRLTAAVPAASIATAGTASVTVVNPTPGGGTSNVNFFDIRQPFAAASFDLLGPSVGSQPDWVITADVNGDGKLDLVTANSFDSTVSVLLGNGDGAFQSQVPYAVAQDPADIVAADFNGDGKLDLSVSAASGFVSILLGNGDGTFQPRQDFDLGYLAVGLAAGDFNGDGKLDLAVGLNYPAAQVAVLLGNGDGKFQNAVDYVAGSNRGNFVAAGDFNGDGILDLALTVGSDAAVAILLGNGDGTFQNSVQYPAATVPDDVTPGDFNGDGRLDLAMTGSGNPNAVISVLLGNGDGTFQSPATYPAPGFTYAITTGDMNGDGQLDLLVTNATAIPNSKGLHNTIVALLGKGDGTFQNPGYFPTGYFPLGVAVGDFNGDGLTDIATANVNDNTASILLQVTAVLSKTSVTFSKVKVGSSATAKVRLSNTGDNSFTISRIGLVGKDKGGFAESNNCGGGLAPGASCTIKIVFKPTNVGKYVGVMTEIRDSAVNAPQTIYLQGTGTN